MVTINKVSNFKLLHKAWTCFVVLIYTREESLAISSW